MATIIKWWKTVQKTTVGDVLLAVIYAGMLIMIAMFFTGNGQFIYEMF